MCLDAVRRSDVALTARQIAEGIMRAKGLDTGDWQLCALITEQIRAALHRLANKGLIFRLGGKPHGWGKVPVTEAPRQRPDSA